MEINNGHLIILGLPFHVQPIVGYATDLHERYYGGDYVLIWNTEIDSTLIHALDWLPFDEVIGNVTRVFTTYSLP